MHRPPSPPRLARALAFFFLKGDAREVIVGDLDQEFADTIESGVGPAAARRRYWRQALASIAAVRRDARAHRHATASGSRNPFRGLSLDVRSVFRVLRRSPGYAGVAMLSLGIGIGANTTIFSVVHQLMLVPLPVDRPQDLRLVAWTPRVDGPLGISNISATVFRDSAGLPYRTNFSYGQYAAMRDAASGQLDLAGYNLLRRLTVAADGRVPIVTSGLLVSGNYFGVIRPPLLMGRGLNDADDQASAPGVVVIGHSFWQRFLGGDPEVLGKTLRVNDTPLVVIGVTAAAYRGLSPGGYLPANDLTIPLAKQPVVSPEWSDPKNPLFSSPVVFWIRLVARTSADREARAREILQATFSAMLAESGIKPEIASSASVGVFDGARGFDSIRTATPLPLRILATVVGVVLLIACINVAGLMLARGVSRQKELALRRALGAGRVRLMRELLLESAVLSVLGGAAGLLVALWIAPVLQSMLAAGLGTRDVSVSLDWPLIAATAAIACTAGILSGLLPAIRFSRSSSALLKDRTAGGGAPKLMIGRALLALQIAISLPLVAGAGLFLRTLHNLSNVDLGFDPSGVVLFNVDPTMNGKTPERTGTTFPALLERVEAIPGVTSATLLENALISGFESDSTVIIDGREHPMYMNSVGPNYLETMDVPLLAGRTLQATDRAGLPPAVVINETAAREFFPNRSAIGGRIKNGSRELEVVGIAADTKYDALRDAVKPTLLHSYLQRPVGAMTVAVKSAINPRDLRKAIEQAVHDVDPALPITLYRTQLEQIDQTIGRERVFARLLTVFGAFALLLACVGLHGVTSYSVARRTSEIGIRMALGAQRSQVLWMVLRQVVIISAIGLAVGVPIAWAVGPVAGSFLFGLEARDPATLAVAAATMVAIAVLAGFLPARRASKLDALSALRAE